MKKRAAQFVLVCLCAGVIASAPFEAAQRTKSTFYSTTATFAEGGIRSDGEGPYYDGLRGVSSDRVAGAGTTNGWFWDLAGRTKSPRRLVYDLSVPADANSVAVGVITASNTHGQVYDLSTIAVGQTTFVRASFHLSIDGVAHVVRFGQSPTDGSSALEVTRVSASEFHVRTGGQGDVARFLRGNGPGEVLLGRYNMPLDLRLTNQ